MGSVTGTASSAGASRLLYIDNLRILLTVLVILLHLSIGYGAPGDWYYNEEGTVGTIPFIAMTLFVVVNQAFFMGFFFMVSSYFSPASLERKGASAFLRDRFLRLGVPILVYALVLNPLLVAVLVVRSDPSLGYLEVLTSRYGELLGVGPTWFLEALLLFSVGFVVWRFFRPQTKPAGQPSPLGNGTMAIFALGLGTVTAFVRIWLPVGWWLEPIHFQLAHFPQYVSLFAVGIVAYNRGWIEGLTRAQGRFWFRVSLGLIAFFPVLFVAGGALDGDLDPFVGGVHWQQLAYAVWEQLTCVAVVVTLLVAFRARFNIQGRLARAMSRAAYATYVVHAPIITLLALGLSGIEMDLALKFVLVAPLAVGASFLGGYVVKLLPVARNIV